MAQCRPDLIKKCFIKSDSDKGVTMIRFFGSAYKGQKECTVLMDHFVPLGNYSNGPGKFLAYNRPEGYHPNEKNKIDIELWAVLLEAAYCKINGTPVGSYKSNYGGHSHKAIMQLTGMNGTDVRVGHADWNPDGMWEKIKTIPGSGDIACCGTKSAASGHHGLTSKGLSPGHAYAILGCAEADGIRLVKVMNPWGKKRGEWTGDYSDDSPLWTRRLKSKIPDFQAGDDGIFWLTIEDWCTNFVSMYWISDSKLLGGRKRVFQENWFKGMHVVAMQDFCRSSSATATKTLKGEKGIIQKIDQDGDCLVYFLKGRQSWAFPKRGDIVPDMTVAENKVKNVNKDIRTAKVVEVGKDVWKHWSWEERWQALGQ